MSNSLDPDQAQCFVGPDLGPNCLQRLSADDKSRHYWGKSKHSEQIQLTTTYSQKTKVWHLMLIFSLGDNMHGKLIPVFYKKKM